MRWSDEATLTEWAQQHVGSCQVEIVRHRDWSRISQVHTPHGQYWLKQLPPGVPPEELSVQLLTGTIGDLDVVAVDETERLILMPDHGQTLREAHNGHVSAEVWSDLMHNHARLQRQLQQKLITDSEINHATGLPIWTAQELAIYAESIQGLDIQLLPQIHQLAVELDNDGVGLTLQHDDLHDGNIFADGRAFDWGDAFVSHPFLVLFIPLEKYRYMHSIEQHTDPGIEQIVNAYLSPWYKVINGSDAYRSYQLAMVFALIGRVRLWATIVGNDERAARYVQMLNESPQFD